VAASVRRRPIDAVAFRREVDRIRAATIAQRAAEAAAARARAIAAELAVLDARRAALVRVAP
jgi:hypothetical protein